MCLAVVIEIDWACAATPAYPPLAPAYSEQVYLQKHASVLW